MSKAEVRPAAQRRAGRWARMWNERMRDRDGGSILGCVVAGSSRYWLQGLY